MALLTSPPSKPKAHVFVPLSHLSHRHRGNESSRRPVQLSLFPKFGTINESKFEKRLTNTNLLRFLHANNDRRAAGPVSSQTEGFWFSHMSWLIDSNSEAQRGMRVKWDYHITWLADDLLSSFDFWFGDYNLRPLLVLSESYQMARQPQFPCTGVRLGTSRPEHVNKRVSAFATQSRSPPQADDDVDWVQATSAFFENDTRPIMLFDGVCNLCNGGVKFVRDNDRNRIMRFEALQSEAGKNLLRRSGRAPDDISSVVLVEKDRSYIKSEAVLKIMEYINLPFPQLAFFLQFVPLFVRDFAYDRVANNRYTIFGRSESCEL